MVLELEVVLERQVSWAAAGLRLVSGSTMASAFVAL